ncbi:unnamed protein product [Phytomonas sp. Hart1]|nr:unnamed protein product [Phytomonas sp. Hart1]|eukprot:CCW66424.1 unnamed protein product [Phytomonas sp. isolate Hart1]
MKVNRCRLRRVILGMSIEDAKSKFDSPDARTFLRFAQERHRRGVLHELHFAQRLRDGVASERKCHIRRFAKPTVRGFQAYAKPTPADYVVVELWRRPALARESRALQGINGDKGSLWGGNEKVAREKTTFHAHKTRVLSTLTDAFRQVREDVLAELIGRRQSGALIAGQQESLVDRLIGEVSEASDKGYKSLSSSTHLLEPVGMSVGICGKKDRVVLDAFNSSQLRFPAREGDISYSLWVSGALIADDGLISEFPYHVAKYIVSEAYDSSPQRPPRVEVEVYFLPELYQLEKVVGKAGIAAIRRFIGKVMMRQHEPTPLSTSLLLNTAESELGLYNLYTPDNDEVIQIPWMQQIKAKVSTITGIILNAEEDTEGVKIEKKKEGVSLVWKAWGHLIKDLHVHGDRDFLYISIDRQKEKKENDEHIMELKLLEKTNAKEVNELAKSNDVVTQHKALLKKGSRRVERSSQYVPLPADFVVLECLLERKGLPFKMVVEDISESLTEMQTEALDMLRLSFMNEIEDLEESSLDFIPVLYAPKVVISNAGIIEDRTHSFQRIRIRGSCLAHVEALASSLAEGHWFTDLSKRVSPLLAFSSSSTKPPNLSFSTSRGPHSAALATSNALVGHQLTSVSAAIARDGHRFQPHQTIQMNDYLTITSEERGFWKENYYRLSEIKIVFHSRVDPQDAKAVSGHALSPRLTKHLRIVSRRLSNDADDQPEGDEGEGAKFGKTSPKNSARAKRKRDSKAPDLSEIPPEKAFEYLCTDTEAGSAVYDLRVGDSEGYSYAITLTNIPGVDAASLVKPAVQAVQNKGFINYFGPNRFASYTIVNMHPGLHLLKDEFRAAAGIIVQQFYLDRAIAAEGRRTGWPFSRGFPPARAGGFRLPDFAKGAARQSVGAHGTMLQKVLHNALQAAQLLDGEDGLEGLSRADSSSSASSFGGASQRGRARAAASPLLDSGDPCAEAFVNLIGPRICRILIDEFLSFVWNDILNQRLQRYGTFAILPGDLVRKHPGASAHSGLPDELVYASRKDVEGGKYRAWDVVLPIPGAQIRLPDNHTADLYIVTLKRYGLVFNPESKQWGCFYPKGDLSEGGSDALLSPSSAFSLNSFTTAGSPYRPLTSSSAGLEEELINSTAFYEPIFSSFERGAGGGMEVISPSFSYSSSPVDDEGPIREDLQWQRGNSLGLLIPAGYRSPLYHPASSLGWKLVDAQTADPYHRWSSTITQTFARPTTLLSSPANPINSHPHNNINNSHHSGDRSPNEDDLMDLEKAKGESSIAPSATIVPSSGVSSRKLLFSSNAPSFSSSSSSSRCSVLSLNHRPYRPRSRRWPPSLPLPQTPYWLTSQINARLELRFTLPLGVYPSMLLRELTKMDVNSSDIIDIDKPPQDRRVRSWTELTAEQQATYRKYLAGRRQQRFRVEQPRALSLALLHQHIFRSGGVRNSLIPTLRSYDSVSLPK